MDRVACACGQTKGNAAEAVGEGAPARPAAQTKLRWESGVFPVPLATRHNSGPPHTRATALWGPDTRPHSSLPGDTGEHSPRARRGGGASADQTLGLPMSPRARGPSRLPPRAGLSFAGRTVGPRKTKEPPPLRPPACPRQPHRVPLPSRRALLALTPRRVRVPIARGP